MKHLMQEANSFSKINSACAVTLNPFVGLVSVYLVDNYIQIYLENAIDVSIFFV